MTSPVQWHVPAEHPVFAGHFPGTPIVPGVMLLDTVLHHIAEVTGINLQACDISTVKFLSPAGPGEVLTIQHTLAASGAIQFDIVSGARKIAHGNILPRILS